MPKISVILTSYNHEKYIHESIQSVLNQTFTDFELIIWDDLSNDKSWEIISSFNDKRIKKFRSKNNLGGGVIEKALRFSRSKYIAIQHSDDIWKKDKLEKQYSFLQENKNFGAVFTRVDVIDESGNKLCNYNHFYYNVFNRKIKANKFELIRDFFENGNFLCHPSVLIRRSCFRKVGLYNSALTQLVDFDFWIRLSFYFDIHIINKRLIKFRTFDNNNNISGASIESINRNSLDYYFILESIRKGLNKANIFKIFSEYNHYDRGKFTNIDYIFSKIILERKDNYESKLFALHSLARILNNPKQKAEIENNYNFNLINYKKIGAKVNHLINDIIEKNNQLLKKNKIIENKYNSITRSKKYLYANTLSSFLHNTKLIFFIHIFFNFIKYIRHIFNFIKYIRHIFNFIKYIRHTGKLLFFVFRHFFSKNFLASSVFIIHEIPKILFKHNIKSVLVKYDFLYSKKLSIISFDSLKKIPFNNVSIIFDHNGGGGSNFFSNQLINKSLNSKNSIIRLFYLHDSYVAEVISDPNRKYTVFIDDLNDLLFFLKKDIKNIHINSLYGYPNIESIILLLNKIKKEVKVQLYYYFHDFHSVCSSPHLLNSDYRYCGVPNDIEVCKKCLSSDFHENFLHPWVSRIDDISNWRIIFKQLFCLCDKFYFFDTSGLEIVKRAFDINQSKVVIKPHDLTYLKDFKPIKIKKTSTSLHIGILGHLSLIKGIDTVNRISEFIELNNLDVKVSVFGKSFGYVHPKVNVLNGYDLNNLPSLVKKNNVNCIFLPSIIPETYSFTLSEAMKLKLPIITYNIGAQYNRLKKYPSSASLSIGASPKLIIEKFYDLVKGI